MYDVERQNKIIEILKERKSVSVHKLTELLYISPATARRDLTALAKKGVLKRTFGGAIIVDATSEESSVIMREQTMVKSKRYIGEKCAAFINNNQSIFVDSSSTVTNLIPFLVDFKYLSVITNGLNVASLLTQSTSFRVILVGGEIISRSNSTIGPAAIYSLNQFHCDLCVLSCSGIDVKNGVSESSLDQSELKRIMMSHSGIKILLADCSKFGKTYLSKTCEISDFDIIITDQKPNDEFINYCSEKDVKLLF